MSTFFKAFCFLSLAVLAQSCSSCNEVAPQPIDLCESITCSGHGTCNDGTCACSPGYEGANCETETRAKFLGPYFGIYTFSKNGTNISIAGYFIEVTGDPGNATNIVFSKGYNATLIGNGILSFPSQQWTASQKIQSGSGTFSSNALDFSFTGVETDGSNFTVKFAGTR